MNLLMIALIGAMQVSDVCLAPATQYDRGRMSVYDPALGGINCDDDCTTVSMGYFHPDMYKVAGACHPALYGATVRFYNPLEEEQYWEFHCVDNMGVDALVYYPWNRTCMPWFDVLWPLTEETAPYWTLWNFSWEVVEWGGAWNWYVAEIAPYFE